MSVYLACEGFVHALSRPLALPATSRVTRDHDPAWCPLVAAGPQTPRRRAAPQALRGVGARAPRQRVQARRVSAVVPRLGALQTYSVGGAARAADHDHDNCVWVCYRCSTAPNGSACAASPPLRATSTAPSIPLLGASVHYRANHPRHGFVDLDPRLGRTGGRLGGKGVDSSRQDLSTGTG